MTAVICPGCGYDFPQENDSPERTGWEYSAFAELSLSVGALTSVLLAFATAYASVMALRQGMIINGLTGLATAMTFYALFIVFLRVKK